MNWFTGNEYFTLANIPSETFEYRLGSRSALEFAPSATLPIVAQTPEPQASSL